MKWLRLVSISLILLFLAHGFGTVALYNRLSPQLSELGLAEADRVICQRINNEILALCEEGTLNTDHLIRVRKNAAGKIVSLETDTEELNRLRAVLTDRIAMAIDQKKGFTLSVPAGSLTDSGLLSWMRFPLRVQYTPLGAVTGDIKTTFSDGGINQTKYSITAEVTVSYLLLLPGENPRANAVTSVPLGEIVIVGDVPRLYT